MQLPLTNQEAPNGVEHPPNETNELELMFKNDAMQVPTNMEQQPQHDGAIGHANPNDLVEVGVVYKRMNHY
jgi:hypothetical protein